MRTKKVSLRFTVGLMFTLATILTAIIAISLQYHFSRNMATEHALTKLSLASEELNDYIEALDSDAIKTARLLATVGRSIDVTKNESEMRSVLTEAIKNNPLFYSIYIGNEEEDFYQVINLASSPTIRSKLSATKLDRWVIFRIKGDKQNRVRESYYYDDKLKLREKTTTSSNFFPSQRPWYISANSDAVTKTRPYLFQHLQITGQTYSYAFTNLIKPTKRHVLGVDIVLASLASKLGAKALGFEANSNLESFLHLESGEIITSNQKIQEKDRLIPKSKPLVLSEQEITTIKKSPAIKISNQNSWEPIDFAISGQPKGYAIEILDLIEEMTAINFEYINGFTWTEFIEQYKNNAIDALHSIQETRADPLNGHFSQPMYELTLALATKQGKTAIGNYSELYGKKVAIAKGWAISKKLKNDFPNINIQEYPSLKASLEAVQNGRAFAAINARVILANSLSQYFYQDMQLHEGIVDINEKYSSNFHLVMQEEHSALLPIINKAIENISNEQREYLKGKWLNYSLKPSNTMVPYPELFSEPIKNGDHSQIIKRIINGEEKFIYTTPVSSSANNREHFSVIIAQDVILSKVSERVMASIGFTALVMALLMPLAWLFGAPIVSPIRQLTLETQKIKARKYNTVKLIPSPIKEIWELSCAISEMSQALKEHEIAQEEFVESFVKLIAQAIDDQSAYTAGHCNRVPEIGMMLADAVEKSDSPEFHHFKFADANERREFRIAAWLHDCGKITTPEHIVDKGSKLEANYNRINEIRTRFEVLWRDVEIDALKNTMDKPSEAKAIQAKLKQQQQQLSADFEFIANVNVGGEFMGPDKIERVKKIAETTWLRHFDELLGLSPLEELLRSKEKSALPVTENLLADKEHHLIKWDREVTFDPAFGIKVDIPEFRYNLGEIYNLCISRGTLTAEDRYVINEHMISTIKILESLPFPEELKLVPRYASTHHETLKGTGYPRKLSKKDLSIPERILVIADIFEALTAADRPYKKAKPISVAINIMYKMALDEHLDMDLFKLFIQSDVIEKYAKKYLNPEQVDSYDVDQYLVPSQ